MKIKLEIWYNSGNDMRKSLRLTDIRKKIISLKRNPIKRLTEEEIHQCLSEIEKLEEFVDGMSPDKVYKIRLKPNNSLGLDATKIYILKQSGEDPSHSRLQKEIVAREELEESPYGKLFARVYVTYISNKPYLPHLMIMDEAIGKTVVECYLKSDPDATKKIQETLQPYLNELCTAFLETRANVLNEEERKMFLQEVTFKRIRDRIVNSSQKETVASKYLRMLLHQEFIVYDGTQIPNPLELFFEDRQQRYIESLGITKENWEKIMLLLETREIRMSPSDITPTNFKVLQHQEISTRVSNFCYDPGRFEEHSYAYSFCKLLGPFASIFWFQVASKNFKVESPRTSPTAPPEFPFPVNACDLEFTSSPEVKQSIKCYTRSILKLLDKSPSHRQLIKNRPFFNGHIIFYSVRQLLADAALREDRQSMAAGFICGAILMRSILMSLNQCVEQIESLVKERETSFETLIQDPSSYETLKKIMDNIMSMESTTVEKLIQKDVPEKRVVLTG